MLGTTFVSVSKEHFIAKENQCLLGLLSCIDAYESINFKGKLDNTLLICISVEFLL